MHAVEDTNLLCCRKRFTDTICARIVHANKFENLTRRINSRISNTKFNDLKYTKTEMKSHNFVNSHILFYNCISVSKLSKKSL